MSIRPELSTKQLFLRQMTLDDVDAFYESANDFDIAKMTASFPWPFTRDVARARIMNMLVMDPEREQVFGIFFKNKFAGGIGLHGLETVNRFMLGYHIGKEFWRRGFATEASCAVLGWAAEKWGNGIIVEAGHYRDNPASGRVLMKAGFIPTGETIMIHCAARGCEMPSIEYEWSPVFNTRE